MTRITHASSRSAPRERTKGRAVPPDYSKSAAGKRVLQVTIAAAAALLAAWLLVKRDRTAAVDATRSTPPAPRPHAAVPSPAAVEFSALLQELRPGDAPRLLAFLATLPADEARTGTAVDLLRAWCKVNPAAAIEFVLADAAAGRTLLAGLLAEPLGQRTEAETGRDETAEASAGVLAALYRQWTEADPAAAAPHALALGADAPRDLMLRIVMENWMHVSPGDAVSWLQALPPGEAQAAGLAGVVSEWTARDPAAAAAVVGALPDGEARTQLLAAAARAWAARDPAATADWVQSLSDVAGQAGAARGALATLAGDDPAAAADWLTRLAPGPAQAAGAELMVSQWAATDLPAAVAWFESLPSGPLREQALLALAMAWVAHDPERVVRAAKSMAEPAAQLDCLEHVVRSWLERDSAAAKSWLARGAPAELRERLGPLGIFP